MKFIELIPVNFIQYFLLYMFLYHLWYRGTKYSKNLKFIHSKELECVVTFLNTTLSQYLSKKTTGHGHSFKIHMKNIDENLQWYR